MSEVAIVIPARLGSSRLAEKSLVEIAGKPMVVQVALRAREALPQAKIIVATDAEKIKKTVEFFGFEARMSPVSLSSGTERVAYIAKDLTETVIVNLQGDEPMIEPEVIRSAIEQVTEKNFSMGSAYCAFENFAEAHSASNVKVVVDKNFRALIFSRATLPYQQAQVQKESDLLFIPYWGKHIGIYVFQKELLLRYPNLEPSPFEKIENLEQLRALHHGIDIGMGYVKSQSIGVDTPTDLEKVRKKFEESKNG